MKVYLLKTALVVSISLLIMLSSMQMPVHGLESKEVINTKADDGWIYYPPYPNYSPSGMPDFTHYQNDWYNENHNLSISCGACACANIVWYIDSMFSNSSGFPGDGKDEFPLVTDYNAPGIPIPGPFTDDHNFNNVNDPLTQWDPENEIYGNEFIETLRVYIGGGYSSEIISGLKNYISDANLSEYLLVDSEYWPSLDRFLYYIEKGGPIIFIVGWYDKHNVRISGHYLTLAGININESKIAVSDSACDVSNPWGRSLHNDASVVSHDVYNIGESPFNSKQLQIDLWSPFSNSYVSVIESLIVILPNNPPNKPTIIGPTRGNFNSKYIYNITCFDPDGDYLGCFIDWGDNSSLDWRGPYKSEINISVNHIWEIEGTYNVRVKAMDKHRLESEWSDPLVVSMPKTKESQFPLLNWFLEKLLNHFPFLEPYLYL